MTVLGVFDEIQADVIERSEMNQLQHQVKRIFFRKLFSVCTDRAARRPNGFQVPSTSEVGRSLRGRGQTDSWDG